MTILALDLATTTGFAVLRADGRIESGEENFSAKKGEGPGARFLKFRHWLIEMNGCFDIGRLVYEEVIGHGPGQVYAAQVYGGFLATMQTFGEHHQIPYKGFPVGTIKKRFAGAGNATKQDMIRQCRALGFTPGGHNEADAIALLHVATDRCPILTMNGASPKKRRAKPQPEIKPGQNPF